MGKAAGEVFKEQVCVLLRAVANVEGGDELGLGINRNPRPDGADFIASALHIGRLLLHADEAPRFVQLDNLAVQRAETFVHDLSATFTHADAKAHDRVTMDARHALNASDAVAFAKHGDGYGFLFGSEVIGHFRLVFEYGMTIFKCMVNDKDRGKSRKKFHHGGVRIGAGRPPTGKAKVKVSVSIDTEIFTKATACLAEPFSNLVEKLLDRHITNPIS